MQTSGRSVQIRLKNTLKITIYIIYLDYNNWCINVCISSYMNCFEVHYILLGCFIYNK